MGSGSSDFSSRSPDWRSLTTTGRVDLVTTEQMDWLDDERAGRHKTPSAAGALELSSPLPPGRVLGELVEQVENGVYFIPDKLLREKGVDELWSFTTALAQDFNRANPGTVVAVERDVVRSGTRMVVILGGDA